MSLRVLLADESASIRKVFQLGLQDYGAEVKSVHNGLDVIQVAEQFEPDIIFADILLQKKNGYEVSEEIREHKRLNGVPVILMWSSFMELDQKKYKTCQANGEMEKPFEVETMRSFIENLVDRTKSQQLSQFLTFPKNIKKEFVEETENAIRAPKSPGQDPSVIIIPPSPVEPENEETTSVFNIQADEESFSVELEEIDGGAPTMPTETTEYNLEPQPQTEDSWETKALNDNSIEKSADSEDDLDQFQSMELNTKENLALDDFLYKPDEDGLGQAPKAAQQTITEIDTPNTPPRSGTLDLGEIEAIVRAHTQEIIKLNIQEQLPIIIERVVREELEKVLQQELAIKAAGPNT